MSDQSTAVTPLIAKLPKNRIASITVDIAKYIEAGDKLIEQAKRAEITDAETYATGGDLISVSRTQLNKAEDERKALVGPYNKLVKFVNDGFKLPKEKFTKARGIVEGKMLTWKKAEDDRLRREAEEERKRLEAEALERASAEKTEEAQDEVLDTAAEAAEEVVEKAGVGLQRGNYGSSTGTRKTYSTNIENQLDFVEALVKHVRDGNKRGVDLGAIVDFRKAGLNKLAENMLEQGVTKMPGATFTASEKIRVY